MFLTVKVNLLILTKMSDCHDKLAGDEAALDTIQELCGELCNLDKEVPKHVDEFLGTVRSKVRETLEPASLKH